MAKWKATRWKHDIATYERYLNMYKTFNHMDNKHTIALMFNAHRDHMLNYYGQTVMHGL